MLSSLYNYYFSDRFNIDIIQKEAPPSGSDFEIVNGSLVDKVNGQNIFPIRNGVPRILDNPETNYSDNFGLQWNKFKKTQFDSFSGLSITGKRFWETTKWKADELKDKLVLEAGSGAGRFTEILAKTGATIVSFDLSGAVEANYATNGRNGNVLIYQGDIYKIPFPDNYFDFIFCHGVLQHTPDPDKAYKSLFSKLKSGGRISIDYYEKLGFSPWSTPKYFWRPLTSKMSPERLLKIIRLYIPIWLPFDTLIRKIPRFGDRILAFMRIPCWNYVNSGFTYRQRLQWAILDTFDALAPAYDFPKSKEEVQTMIASDQNLEQQVFHGGNGIVANVTKK